MDITAAWIITKIIALSIIAVSGLIVGMRIYQGMQRGEDFEASAIRWLVGLAGASALVYAVESFIYNDSGSWASSGSAPHFLALSYAAEAHQAALYLGLAMAIFCLIRVYSKIQKGDNDIYEYMLKWFGSLMFLFMMGWIIDSILG